MAWRPWYQPQLPHTMWGTFAAPHRGQTLREGGFSVHADARRLRLFIFEVFFLGTAIAKRGGYRLSSPYSNFRSPRADQRGSMSSDASVPIG